MSSIMEQVWLKEPGSRQEMLQLERAQGGVGGTSTGVSPDITCTAKRGDGVCNHRDHTGARIGVIGRCVHGL